MTAFSRGHLQAARSPTQAMLESAFFLALGALMAASLFSSSTRLIEGRLACIGDLLALPLFLYAAISIRAGLSRTASRMALSLCLLLACILVSNLSGFIRYGQMPLYLMSLKTLKWTYYLAAGSVAYWLTPSQRRLFFSGLLLAAAVRAGFVMDAFYFNPASLHNVAVQRYQSGVYAVQLAEGPNATALCFVLILALVFGLTGLPALVEILCTIVMAFAICVTGSRVGLITFLVFVVSRTKRGWRVALPICICITYIALTIPGLASSVLSYPTIERLGQSLSGNEFFGLDLGQRTELPLIAARDVINAPFVGRGFSAKFYATDLSLEGGAHNQYVQFAVEFGIVGLFVWCWALWRGFKACMAARGTSVRNQPLATVGLLYFAALSEVYLQSNNLIALWMMAVATALAATRAHRRACIAVPCDARGNGMGVAPAAGTR